MVSKWLWMVLVAFLLGGGWCDGCWEQEKTALLQLKPFFSFNWGESEQSSNCCEWERVECNNSTGRVIRLFLNRTERVADDDLLYYYHTGSDDWYGYYYNSWSSVQYVNASLFLPFEELNSLYLGGNSIIGCLYNEGFNRLSSKLNKLKILDLNNNQFNDSILTSLSELSSLKSLNLAVNQFTGTNPVYGIKKLSELKNLETLDLSNNMLGNKILLHLHDFRSLKSLRLQDCGLKGIIDMLEFNNLMNLKELYLGKNQIESFGSLFQSKGQLGLSKLEVLGLSDNLFNNNIFSSLHALPNLKSLFLGSNKLKGAIRIKELNALSKLEELRMWNNAVNDFVPSQDNETELKLMNLEVLDLSGNLFNTNILRSLGRLSKLKSLNLDFNQLEGSVDLTVINALSNLEELSISCNDGEDLRSTNCTFSPKSLDEFSSLKILYLEGCSFNGTMIIQKINALSNLEELFISCSAREGLRSTDCNLPPKSLSECPSSLKTLHLGGFNFNGTMSTQKLHNFRNLEELTLEGSFLQTTFLRTFGELTSLKSLGLYSCNISNVGNLTPPQDPLQLKNLESLHIYRTSLENNFLQEIGPMPSLKFLSLADSEFKLYNGTMHTHQGPLQLKNLESLHIYSTSLENNFLQEIGPMPSLKFLSLLNSECKLYNGTELIQGPLQLKNLESLDVWSTSLENNFLQKMGPMPSLKFLSLTDSEFKLYNDTKLIQGFCEYTSLQGLSINGNNLRGNLPECFSNLTSLQQLGLSYNQFSGNIFVLKSLTSLKRLDLSSNQFSGNLSALETLTSLEELDLSSNQFSGNISALESLTSLEILSLSSNQFSGNISAFKSLTSLQFLSLSNNYFQIPSSLRPFFNLSKLMYISVDSNSLYADTEMHSLAPTFQLEEIVLSCCGDVGSFPQFLYHQHELRYVDLSNIYFKRDQFPYWLLKNNTELEELTLANTSLSGSLQQPFPSHSGLSYLDISNNFLNGTIPVEIGAKLPSLSFLNMSKNNFSGNIPSSFSDMSSLSYLDLSNNALQGKIFSRNFSLRNLQELQLKGNYFTGGISDFLSNSSFLSTLDVSNNQFSGKIPSWMGNMSSLETIIMSNNHLEGTIPVEFCQLDLILLDLSVNNISGSLPSCFGPSQIRQVHLSKNRLQGTLADALRNSFVLVTLDVSYNLLTGGIPSWIGRLSNLSYLLLDNNKFEGRIPIELCNLSHLSLINLSHNNLSGRIPPCLKITTLEDISEDYVLGLRAPGPNPFSFNEPIEFTTKNVSYLYKGNILPLMSGIDLSWNNLVGEIPYEIGYSRDIKWLILSHNRFTGPIPPTFANLMQMESLDLSYNNLSGNIPPEFAILHFLSYFNVSYNNLSGKTPERIGQLGAFDEGSYLGNPFLCGTLVQKNCSPIEPPLTPEASTGNKEEDGLIDMVVFYVSFIVSYIIVLLSIAAVLYINPYWRQAWFYHVEMGANSCYYFVVDNLPEVFCCGNM